MVTGLSSIPKMFAGIGLIILGILCHVVLTALIRRREPESRATLMPGGRPDANFLARFFATFWRASFLDALLVLGAFLLVAQVYQDRYWFLRSGRLLGSPKGLQLSAWPGYLLATLICMAFVVYLEVSAFDKRLWGYSEAMPTLFRKIGIVPVFALCWTPTAMSTACGGRRAPSIGRGGSP
jgi:hypothetical protein